MENQHTFPEEILKLAAAKDFFALTDSEKEIVLRHISDNEYQKLRYSSKKIKEISIQDMEVFPSYLTKEAIHSAFLKHSTKKIKIARLPLVFWKVAALFFLAVPSLLFLRFQKETTKKELVYLPIHDTIFQILSNNITKLRVDTVVVYKYKNSNVAHKAQQVNIPNTFASIVDSGIIITPNKESDFNTLTPSNFFHEKIDHCGKTMNQDTLLKLFSFARI